MVGVLFHDLADETIACHVVRNDPHRLSGNWIDCIGLFDYDFHC